jgi:hypothetical protein
MGIYTGYAIEKIDSPVIFEFISEGPKGVIRKRVYYQKIDVDFYNLVLGDMDLETDTFNTTIVTDNQDTRKVLATVAETVKIFLNDNEEASIYAKGSTAARTRLYRIGISNYLDVIIEEFDIYGLLENNKWDNYEKSKNYSAFLITKK